MPMQAPLLHRLPPPPRSAMAALWQGWLPTTIRLSGPSPQVEWLHSAGRHVEAPFYRLSVLELLRQNPGNTRNRTTLEMVHHVAEALDSVPPTGFIFHMSRCGSTLVSNALQCLEDTFVASEPQPICELLSPVSQGWTRAPRGWAARRSALLRSMVHVFGQRRQGKDHRYFIKFTSTNALQLDLVRRLWPEVPWLFVYRNPVDVVVSNLARLPSWMQLSPEQAAFLFGWPLDSVPGLSPEAYCARAVGQYCEAAVRNANARAHFLNYEDLDPERLLAVLGEFGVQPSDAEKARISKSMKQYSKDPRRTFQEDSQLKRRIAGPAVERAVKQWSLQAFDALNRHRRRLA